MQKTHGIRRTFSAFIRMEKTAHGSWSLIEHGFQNVTYGIRRTFRVKPTGEIELRVPGVPRARFIAPEGCVDEKSLKRCEDRAHDAESAQKNTTNFKTRQYFRAKSPTSVCLEC
jgi:hypothetical protein